MCDDGNYLCIVAIDLNFAMPPFSVLFLIIFPFVFVAFWCLISSTISGFGWKKLAKGHTAYSPPEGQKFSWQSLSLGRWAKYRKCVSFHIGKSGLRISIMPIFAVGHPTLFFQWSKLRYRKEQQGLFGKRFLYDMGTPRAGRMLVSLDIHRAIQAQVHRF